MEERKRPRRCRTRYLWWGYVKNCIRVYPARRALMEAADAQLNPDGMPGNPARGVNRPTERSALTYLERRIHKGRRAFLYLRGEGQWKREYEGVRLALENTAKLPDGKERLALVDMVFWKESYTIATAAFWCNVSERTATSWHEEFIMMAGYYMGLFDSVSGVDGPGPDATGKQ